MRALYEQDGCLEAEAADPSRWAEPIAASPIARNAPLAALAGESLAKRFRHWRGASGRRYVFSVYDRRCCPAYDDAVLIVAEVDADGERRASFIADTGVLPELVLAQADERAASAERAVEFHVHLLAATRAERAALIADLYAAQDQSRLS